MDNVWLDIVAQQQAKIDGFAHSGAASMRAYINHGLIGTAVFLTAGLGAVGAALSLAGGSSATTRSRLYRPVAPAVRKRGRAVGLRGPGEDSGAVNRER